MSGGKRIVKKSLSLSVENLNNVKPGIINQIENNIESQNNNENNINISYVEKKCIVPEELEKELKFKKQLSILKEKVTELTNSNRKLQTALKKLEATYDHDINKMYKAKKKRPHTKDTGFIKKKPLPQSLASLIGEQEGVLMSMPNYTKRFFAMLKEKGLFYSEDGRVFRANDEIKKVFGLSDSVNLSTDNKDKNGLNLYNLQTHISKIFDPEGYEKKLKAKENNQVQNQIQV